MKHLLLSLVFLLLGAVSVRAQAPMGGEITWEHLSRISWNIYTDETLGFEVQEPLFDKSIEALDGEMISIIGHIIPVDTDDNTMVLSQFPFSNCFFCGGAGPETVMQLDLKKDRKLLNKRVLLQGRFQLNKNDFYKLVYELNEVELIDVLED